MWYQGAVVCAAVAVGLGMALGPAPAGQAERGAIASAAPAASAAPLVAETPAPATSVARAVPEVPDARSRDRGPPPTDVERVIRVKRGDTFMKVLRSAGASRVDAASAIAAMRKVYDPRSLKPGLKLTITLRRDAAGKSAPLLMGYAFDAELERAVRVERGANDAFSVSEIKKNLALRHRRAAGVIKTSLFRAGIKAGLPVTVLVDLMRLYSWDVDFQRDIQPKDGFDVLFETFHLPDGSVARSGEILFAELRLSGVRHRLYRFKAEGRRAAYFDYTGRSARKALMKTPIDGARLSSGYGRRRHPILGYTKMHRGIDFAAPRGTPIYSAGNGTVVRAGRNGAYGKYIRIRHNGRYSTAYAHLNGYARGLRKGRRVRQGQIIGYVGSTGRSTGAHLHYEILIGNRQVNPFRIKLPSGRRLNGRELKQFKAARDDIEQRLAGLPSTIKVTGR